MVFSLVDILPTRVWPTNMLTTNVLPTLERFYNQTRRQSPGGAAETVLPGASWPEAAIAASGIEMTYPQMGGQRVLQGIDLAVTPGTVQLLMGPSGSGKTTLLSILGGILTPTAGQVRLLGQDLGALPARKRSQFRRNHLGFIFQEGNLFPALTAMENVEVALNLRQIRGDAARERAYDLLNQVGLSQQANHLPSKLSGGQKQRVAIARALANQPRIIFADEPTAALDSKSGYGGIDLLCNLARNEGCTVLMVTHDPRIVDVADNVLYLEDGQICPDSPYCA